MLTSSRILDFLGLHFNPEKAIISPPNSFLDSLTSVLSRLATSMVMPARKISSITSRISHFVPFIHHGRLQLRFLRFRIKRHWAQHRQSWDTPLQLDAEFLSHLRWLPDVLQGVPLHLPEPNLFFFTDASLTGWGARWQARHLSGQWSPKDSSQHINWLELEAIRLALLQWGPQWHNQTVCVYCDKSTVVAYIRKQGGTHSISLFNKTLENFRLLDQFGILLIPTHLPGAKNTTADALSRRNSPSQTEWRLPQETLLNLFSVCGNPLMDMFATAENRVTPIYISPYPDDRAWGVDALSISWDGLGLVYVFPPAPIVPKTLQKIKDSQGTTVMLIASQHSSRPTTAQPTSSHSVDRRGSVPVRSQHSTAPVPQRASPVRSSRLDIIRDILKQHDFPDAVVDMAADPLRDSSSHVYNSQWKAFAKWANDKDIQSKDLSYVTLAEYLVHLYAENKQVNTIKVHRAAIASVLKMLNPPTTIQEDIIHNIIRRMSILRPRTQEVLHRWHLSVVLKGLMKPPFAIHGSDKNISLELLSYKTAFLIALAIGAGGSELVALSRAPHNLEFKSLENSTSLY